MPSPVRVQRKDLPSSATLCPMSHCIYCEAGLCDEAFINKGNSDAACHRMTNRKVLEMLQSVEREASTPTDSLKIMTVLDGRITTNVELLPNALRTNRPTRAESEVAAAVIERLYAEVQAARRAGPSTAGAGERLAQALADIDASTRADAVVWLRDDATSAREHDPNAGIRANRPLGDLLEAIAAFIEAAGQGEGQAQTSPDPVVISQEDLDALDQVEDLVRGNGLAEQADRLTRLRGVLTRVAQGREASHYRDSYDRAVQRLVLMRQLIPAEALRSFELEWRTRKQEPLASAAQLSLPEAVRGELRQMAEHCGAVSYSPPPMRAVRGVSLTFEQLEALAVLVSGAVWPVPGGEP